MFQSQPSHVRDYKTVNLLFLFRVPHENRIDILWGCAYTTFDIQMGTLNALRPPFSGPSLIAVPLGNKVAILR